MTEEEPGTTFEKRDAETDEDADDKLIRRYTQKDAQSDLKTLGDGYHTGIQELEARRFRWLPGRLYGIIGRPGHGKTALLLELVMRHVQQRKEKPDKRGPAVFVSYEVPMVDIYIRLLRREVAESRRKRGVSISKTPAPEDVRQWLRDPEGHPEHAHELEPAAEALDAYQREDLLRVVDGDADATNVEKLVQELEDHAEEAGKPFSLVCVDYWQKVKPVIRPEITSRYLQLSDVADRLRRFAKGEKTGEYACPVVLAAQVKRTEKDEQPLLHQIREADDLANDASGVLSVWFQGQDEEHPDDRAFQVSIEKNFQVSIEKNRDGVRGKPFPMTFHADVGLFLDVRGGRGPRGWYDDGTTSGTHDGVGKALD